MPLMDKTLADCWEFVKLHRFGVLFPGVPFRLVLVENPALSIPSIGFSPDGAHAVEMSAEMLIDLASRITPTSP